MNPGSSDTEIESGRPQDDKKSSGLNDKQRFSLARFAYISQFTGEIVVFVVIGVVIDHQFRTMPWGVAGLSILGLAVATYHLVRSVLRS